MTVKNNEKNLLEHKAFHQNFLLALLRDQLSSFCQNIC